MYWNWMHIEVHVLYLGISIWGELTHKQWTLLLSGKSHSSLWLINTYKASVTQFLSVLVCLWLLILVGVICAYMLHDKLFLYVLCFHMQLTCQGQLSWSGVVVVLLYLSVFMCCCFNAILQPRPAVENELVWPTSNIPSLMLKHAVRDKSWSPRLTCIIQPDSQ